MAVYVRYPLVFHKTPFPHAASQYALFYRRCTDRLYRRTPVCNVYSPPDIPEKIFGFPCFSKKCAALFLLHRGQAALSKNPLAETGKAALHIRYARIYKQSLFFRLPAYSGYMPRHPRRLIPAVQYREKAGHSRSRHLNRRTNLLRNTMFSAQILPAIPP